MGYRNQIRNHTPHFEGGGRKKNQWRNMQSRDHERAREMHTRQKKGRRVILFPLPFQGHVTPMLQLGNIIYSKGFSVTVIHTQMNSPEPRNYPHFTFHPIPDGFEQGQAPVEARRDVVAFVSRYTDTCVVPFKQGLAELLDDATEEPAACLVVDALLPATRAVAASFGLPWMVLRTCSVSSTLVVASLPRLREKGYLSIKDSRLEEPVLDVPPLKVKDIPLIKTEDPENLLQIYMRMVKGIKASAGIIWNSAEELEEETLSRCRSNFVIPNFAIGPFDAYFRLSSTSALEQDSAISWLNKQAPGSVIYVSFGTVAAIDESEFLEIAWGLANSKRPFLWVVREWLVRGSEWLEPLPDGFLQAVDGRGHIVKWVPQREVLAHPSTAAFWTHNGWNSTLESICEGVPMICSPCFGDQKVNALYVSSVWRVGIQLGSKLQRGEIEAALTRVMDGAEAREIRNRITNLKEKMEGCFKPGGSSHRSLQVLTDYIQSFQKDTNIDAEII